MASAPAWTGDTCEPKTNASTTAAAAPAPAHATPPPRQPPVRAGRRKTQDATAGRVGSARVGGRVFALAPHALPDPLEQRPRGHGVGPGVQVRPHQRLQPLLEFGLGPAHRIISLLRHLLFLRVL